MRPYHTAVFFLALILLGAAELRQQAPQNPVVSRYFVLPESKAQMDVIADRFSVEHRIGNGFEVFVTEKEKADFIKLAPNAKLLEADIRAKFQTMSRADKAGFHTFDSVKTHLQKIVTEHPDMASYETYGTSMEGRPLHVLRLLTKNGPAKKTPVAITSATHGNEITTVEVVFGILEHLVSNYGKNPRITALVDNHELYFLPVINPDGYVRQDRLANGIDPNRDYPWPELPNRNPNPCIKNVMKFFTEREMKGSIDFHSAASMIMYPWAYTEDGLPESEESGFIKLTKKMASFNGFQFGQISKIIYVAKGSSADYYYWKLGTRALGIELSQEGSSSLIPSQIQENLESTLTFIESF